MNMQETALCVFTHPYSALWIAGCDKDQRTVIARLTGVSPRGDNQATCYVPLRFSHQLIPALLEKPDISVVCAQTETFESFQFKGKYISHRNATAQECEEQKQHLLAFSMGTDLLKLPAEMVYLAYVDDDFIAVDVTIDVIYDQTPKKGTGNPIAASV